MRPTSRHEWEKIFAHRLMELTDISEHTAQIVASIAADDQITIGHELAHVNARLTAEECVMRYARRYTSEDE